MRNTILALIAASPLTVVAFTPVLADGLCSNYPNLDGCPIYGIYENPTPLASPHHVTPRHIRHAHTHYSRYPNHG